MKSRHSNEMMVLLRMSGGKEGNDCGGPPGCKTDNRGWPREGHTGDKAHSQQGTEMQARPRQDRDR